MIFAAAPRRDRWVAIILASLFVVLLASAEPWIGRLEVRDAAAWPQGRSGNYGTVKYFIDEQAGEKIPIEVTVQVYADGKPATALEVQAFTNLNRRDFAKIFESDTDAGKSDSYYMTVPMTYIADSGSNHVFKATLRVEKTGAYRLTTRFREPGGPWHWHNDSRYDGMNQRDCAIVVSPKKVLGLTLFEANPLVIEATAPNHDGRSTLEDLTDEENDAFNPIDLAFIRQRLGFNTLWLMPIFPVTTQRWDPVNRRIVANQTPGSPYATRDYWSVSPELGADGTPGRAMHAFQHLVDQAENIGLNVFIDVAFNHAGRDVAMGQGAVDLGFIPAADATKLVREVRPAWATHRDDYRRHADGTDTIALFAPADRLGEHTWYDAGTDWFFGDYSSLGPKPYFGDASRGGALDERDLFYTNLNPAGGHDTEVEALWKYFAYILPYWLQKTNNKLDGIRADFAQGLPPQLWEYIVNRTRQKKWDFVFLAEALDPDTVRYRVNRAFDLITTVDHFLYRDTGVAASRLIDSLESEANLYGYNAAVMHNGTSHDEDGNENAWLMAARYAVAASSYGVPMVFMGQPLGVPNKVNFQSDWTDLKRYWDNANPSVFDMYRRLNAARENNPALRGTARYFLVRQFGGDRNENIFAVARWAGDNVLLVFVNLRDRVVPPEVFAIPSALPLDRGTGVTYQVVNLAADNPGQTLWPQPRSADDIYRNGVYVRFGYPNEVQYLLLKRQ